jgi:quercetin dioxygenase-like cupin family protein
MPLSTLAEAPVFTVEGFTFHPLAVPSRGSIELAIWALDIDPGARSAPHSMDREEVFVVVSGRIAATVAGVDVIAEAGDAIVVPPHAQLQLGNASAQEAARATVVTSVGMLATVGDDTFPPPWAQ